MEKKTIKKMDAKVVNLGFTGVLECMTFMYKGDVFKLTPKDNIEKFRTQNQEGVF